MGVIFVLFALGCAAGAVVGGFMVLVLAGIRFCHWVRRAAGKHRQRKRERMERDRVMERREERIRRAWPR
jgi:uncharacterized protein (DUF2062 family)